MTRRRGSSRSRVLRPLLVTAIVGATSLLAQPAGAATITVDVQLPMEPTNWSDSVTVARFDPALGDLIEVDLDIETNLQGTVAYENLADSPATLSATLSATVTVDRPGAGATLATLLPTATGSDTLSAFDGDPDFAGASGATYSLNDDKATTLNLTSAADLALFTGTTPINLPTAAVGTSTGPTGPDVDSELTTEADASVSVTYTYVADTNPPDPPVIDSAPPAFTSDPNPEVLFHAEPGETTECSFQTPTTAGAWAPCTSPWYGALGVGDDGLSTFSVRATDGAGNTGLAAVRTFTLDRAAPPQPNFTSTPPPLSQNPHPVWTFTIESGATARCSFDGVLPATACSSPATIDLTAALDGSHSLTVHAVDNAGNEGLSVTSAYTLDRAAPAPPSITLPPATPSNDPTPTWTFVLAPEAVTASCSVDGGAFSACASPFTANLVGAPDGPHTLAIHNADAAGNQSGPATGTYHLDQAAPVPPTITSPVTPSGNSSPVWGISTEAGATTECRLDAGAWTACTGSFTTTFASGSDGPHLLTVRATDAAGNLGTEATATYTLDTTPPPAPTITSSPADPSNSPSATWIFTAEPGAATYCSVDGGVVWTTCSSPFTRNLSGAPDGVYQFAVRATDPVGNTGLFAADAFTLDRTVPAAPSIDDAPDSPGSAPTVTWTFTTPEGTTAQCQIDGVPIPSCWGSIEATFSTDGDHWLSITALDAAGNLSATTSSTYRLDRVGPAAPAITSGPLSPSSLTTPQWTFTMETFATGRCSLDGAPWVSCSDTFSANLSAAPDGPHTLIIQAIDQAGNLGAIATDTYLLDRTPPGVPVFTEEPLPFSPDDTPTWTFGIEGGAVAQCRLDDGPWESCAGTFTADLSLDLDGTHSLEVRAIDAVGNVGSTAVTAYELDRVAPEPAEFTATPLSPGNDPDPAWELAFEPGATAHCTLDGVLIDPCDSTVTAELVADGTHQLAVWVTDAAGNTSITVTNDYLLDRAAPTTPLLTAPQSPDRDREPEWAILVDPDAVAECAFDDGLAVACGSVFSPDEPLDDGTHHLVVVARDAAGNVSAAAISPYVLDTVPPPPPVLTHIPRASGWHWSFSIEAGAQAECSVDGHPWATCTSPTPAVPNQPGRFEVRAVDRAGNLSSVTSTTLTLSQPPPVPPPPPSGPGPDPTEAAGPGGSVLPRPPLGANPGRPDDVFAPDAADAAEDAAAALVASGFRRPDGPFAGPVGELLQSAAETTTIPGIVVLLVIIFVAAQNRIDRRDPKLANAPLRHEPEYLEFK